MSSAEAVRNTINQGLDHLNAASPDVVNAHAAEIDGEAPIEAIGSLVDLIGNLVNKATVLETQIIPESITQAENAKSKLDEALHSSDQIDAVMAIGYTDLLGDKNQVQAASARALRVKYERALRSLSHAKQHLSSALSVHADIIQQADEGAGYQYEARTNAEYYRDNRL